MSINPKIGYSDETEALIQRQCTNVEREDFVLDKRTAQEAILKTYDLFGLSRPKKIVWCIDIFDKKFDDMAGSARSAGSAQSAWSARSAGSAGSAQSAWSAWSAGSARSAQSAWSAWYTALDYDFDRYIMEYEYIQNPDLPINNNDLVYLEYCNLLMKAKEAGSGYRVQWEEILYIVPTPLVRLDSQLRYHSDEMAAIRWKDGKEFFYLCGVSFEKDLWQKITSRELSAGELAEIIDVDQRKIAMTYLTGEDFIREMKAEIVNEGMTIFYEHLSDRRIQKVVNGTDKQGYSVTNRLYKIPAGETYEQDKYFLHYTNPSTGEEHISFVTNFVKEVGEDADECMRLKHNCSTKEEFIKGGGA